MPVTSFVITTVHDWTRPPAPSAPAPTPRVAPKTITPRCKKTRKRAPKRPISPQCRTVLIDRLEAAIADGRIELCAEEMPCESLDFTLAELAFLQRILFPEEYLDPFAGRKPPRPTATAPGSAERIAEYAFRVAERRVMHVAGDATAHGAHDRGLAITQRANGSGVKVVGWSGEG